MAIDRILMIVSDTVRTDMLGYNGGHVRTPNLDRLAAKSMVFDRYYASSFPTVPARYDYLTGKPAFAGVGWGALPRSDRSIATALTEVGYTTLGVVDTPFYQVNGYSYDRGFNFFYDMKSQLLGTPHYSSYSAPNKTKRQGEGKLPQWPITGKVKPDPRTGEMDCPAPLTMVQAARCLEEIYADKFFALVDTWDPHEPWDPPAYYTRHYLPDYAGERVHPPYGDCKKHGMTDRDIAVGRALYSGELELVDRWIGHLLADPARLCAGDDRAAHGPVAGIPMDEPGGSRRFRHQRLVASRASVSILERHLDAHRSRGIVAIVEEKRIVDLSHVIEHGMVTYKGLPAPHICDFWEREGTAANYDDGSTFQIGRIDMVANTGTYVDSPFHRYSDGADLSELKLPSLADVPGIVIRRPWENELAIDAEHLEGRDVDGKAVLVHTGWDRNWRTDAYFGDHPYLTSKAAAWLAEHGARLVGIDSCNIDNMHVRTRPVHTRLLGAGIPICEHMTALGSLPDEGFRFSAVPPKLRGMGSFPVRAYAVLG